MSSSGASRSHRPSCAHSALTPMSWCGSELPSGGGTAGAVGATLLVRPRVALPKLTAVVCSAGTGAVHADVVADDDGQCVNAIDVSSEAPPGAARELAAMVSAELRSVMLCRKPWATSTQGNAAGRWPSPS